MFMHISYVFNYTEALWKHEMYLVGLLLFFSFEAWKESHKWREYIINGGI